MIGAPASYIGVVCVATGLISFAIAAGFGCKAAAIRRANPDPGVPAASNPSWGDGLRERTIAWAAAERDAFAAQSRRAKFMSLGFAWMAIGAFVVSAEFLFG